MLGLLGSTSAEEVVTVVKVDGTKVEGELTLDDTLLDLELLVSSSEVELLVSIADEEVLVSTTNDDVRESSVLDNSEEELEATIRELVEIVDEAANELSEETAEDVSRVMLVSWTLEECISEGLVESDSGQFSPPGQVCELIEELLDAVGTLDSTLRVDEDIWEEDD